MSDTLDRLRKAVADRYGIEREIGSGGMATVYLAEDLKHHRKVAIKVLRPDLAATLGPERFLREIEIAAQLQHPNILPLLDSGEADDFLYYVMPFVEGHSLRDKLAKEGELPLGEAVRILRDVVDALTAAHAHGVVHRDIKPENVLLSGRHALVTDFGVAKAVSEATGREQLTTAGVALGTPAYMAPEQASADPHIDHRVDIYAVGAVAYELLTGRPVFMGTTPQQVLSAHVTEAPLPVTKHRETVPAAMEAVVMRCLEKKPADRWQSAEELLPQLEALATPSGGTTPTDVQPIVAVGRRSRWPVFAGAAVVLLAVAAAVWALAMRAPATDSGAIPLDTTAIAVLPFRIVGADSASQSWDLARSMGDLFELKVTGEFGRRIAHPPSVVEQWRRAGGTPDTPLAEQTELGLARALGVGALVRGTVVESDSGITLAASLMDVVSGELRVPTVQVDGTVDQRFDLVDQLIVELLARDAGHSPQDIPRLRHHRPEAVQALLAGHQARMFSSEQKRFYREALAEDSSLVDAAFYVYANGEDPRDTVELRYAWEHQDLLPERLRAYLQVIAAGRHGAIRTEAQKIAGYEALATRWPEWQDMREELGGELALFGALASIPDWRTRAREVLESVASPSFYAPILTELVILDGDSARARLLIDSLEAQGASALRHRWRLALQVGDSSTVRELLAEQPGLDLAGVALGTAKIDGRGAAIVDSLVETFRPEVFTSIWGWQRGQERWWRDERPETLAWLRRAYPPSDATIPLYYTLFLGVPEDPAAREAARRLERLASDDVGAPVPPDTRALAVAWHGLWRAKHGDVNGAEQAVRFLETAVERPHRFTSWVRLIEVLSTQARGGDVRAALLRLDSVVREVPLPTGFRQWYPWPTEVQNLVLARMLREHGEPERALAAVRRRSPLYYNTASFLAIPEYLREEGRLAAMVGDTAGAVQAYNHYLALRENPDQPWHAQRDSVRAELAALVAR